MANSKCSYNYNRKTWEDAEFPILCQTCLGSNPYLRMQKEKFGGECKICQRPFTCFRWQPGKGARYKKTEVCQTCAKLKNVCQTCLLDLEYGLPVQVRDYALQIPDDLPKQGANRDYYMQNVERELAQTDGTVPAGAVARAGDQGASDLLRKLARTQPYYDRNRPHICSFWVKGECKRGEECPYRHEKPTDPDDPLSDQNMRDRFYGSNDPVAEKLLNRAKAMPILRPPDDPTITTLYIGNLGNPLAVVTEDDLRNYFYQFGEIRQLTLLENKGCAFIQYTTRPAAEAAADKAFNKLVLKGRRMTIRWGRPQAQSTQTPADRHLDPVPGLPHPLPVPNFFGEGIPSKRTRFSDLDAAPPAPIAGLVVPEVPYPSSSGDRQSAGIYYPSQDPSRLGSKGDLIGRE